MNRVGRIAVVFLLSVAVSGIAMAEGDRRGRRPLEGTWKVMITVRNCQTGAPFGPPFPAMATFADGTVITSDSSIPPSRRSLGHGVWSHSNGRTYSAVIEAFLFDANGAFSGRQRFQQSIELTGRDTFEATVAAEITNASEVVVGRGCATSSAERLR
jgi:hypothetical protein